MSSQYSTSIKVDYIDPRFDASNRVEFRLNPDLCYYSNLRVVNLGALLGTNSDELILSPAGLYGFIKHVRLMDGAREIDSCRFANRYLAFKNVNNSNRDNYELGQQKHKGEVGFHLEDDRDVHPGLLSTRTLSTTSAPSQQAYLDLRECLPVLEKMTYLDTSMMPNLRVEMEFQLDAGLLLAKNENTVAKTTPLLVAEEIVDEALKSKLKANFKGVVWNTIEHDVVQVPSNEAVTDAAAAGVATKQGASLRVSGFDNKIVGRVVMTKSYTDKSKYIINATSIVGNGDLSSVAQLDEKINFRLNGRGVFSGNGLDTPAKRASAVADAWGDVNIVPYAHQLAMGLNVVGTLNNPKGSAPKAGGVIENARIGQGDYVGVDLSDRVSQLIIDYERTGINDTGAIKNTSAGLDLNIYAEVQRSLMMDGKGGYVVRYN